jgi:hypothetical protein
MMTNKEKIEQLSEQIKRLATLTEEISERDIYPVSFFSQSYDITNTIQEQLRQIEIAQIELFEKQMKEHQAQILSVEQKKKESLSQVQEGNLDARIANPREQPHGQHCEQLREQHCEQQYMLEPKPPTSPDDDPMPSFKEEMIDARADLQSVCSISPRLDLKKVMSLNDRFLFCRELFANDENLMNRTIADLNKAESLETAMDYLMKRFDWNLEDDHPAGFIACLKKSFL